MTALPVGALVCIISARRFGDAIINASLARIAATSRPDIKWVIWTKPEFIPLFKHMGFENIISSEFPIAGGAPKFFRGGGLSLIAAIKKLRQFKFDASIDFVGDTRESFLGASISGSKHYSPQWALTHWMEPLIWPRKAPLVKYIPIPADATNVYEFQLLMLSKLMGESLTYLNNTSQIPESPKIVFHPFPSAQFRYWPLQEWNKLGHQLLAKGIAPKILCSFDEVDEAEANFGGNALEIKSCPSLEVLIKEMGNIDLLIGVDSFLIHLAAALGKKTISITAGHLPQWWNPPEGIAIGQSGGCAFYPCANQPSCLGKSFESCCIKSITPEQVMHSIEFARNESSH